jgi:hypothetical protein
MPYFSVFSKPETLCNKLRQVTSMDERTSTAKSYVAMLGGRAASTCVYDTSLSSHVAGGIVITSSYVSKNEEVPERMSHRCLFRRQDQRSAARRLLHARFRCKLSDALRRNISYVSAILWWSHQVEWQPASCMLNCSHTISPIHAIGKAVGIGSGSRIAVIISEGIEGPKGT